MRCVAHVICINTLRAQGTTVVKTSITASARFDQQPHLPGASMKSRLFTAALPIACAVVALAAAVPTYATDAAAAEALARQQNCLKCHGVDKDKDGPSFKKTAAKYKETVHDATRPGVRAVCSDCHVPHEWQHKVVAKIGATSDVYHELMGDVNTPAKFEARRLEMAQHQWDRMKATDSRECRNCHSFDAMSKDVQKQSVYNKHMAAKTSGKTCIDCHKGIAHQLPKDYKDPDE